MTLNYLIIHCTATPKGRKVTKKDIENWHYRGHGWSRLGYSDMIHLDGSLENLTPFNQNNEVEKDEMTWGCTGKNSVSRHIVLVGGIDRNGKTKNTFTTAQLKTLSTYINYTLLRHPDILIAGHNQFSTKDCPSFNVSRYLKGIKIPSKNIY